MQTLLSKVTVVVVEPSLTRRIGNLSLITQEGVLLIEEVTECVNETITGGPTSDIPEKLQFIVSGLDCASLKLARNAPIILFSLFCGLIGQETVDSQSENEHINLLRADNWDKILEGILRLLFSKGAAEAIAGSYSSTASSIIASSRLDDCHSFR